jgi:hypothetical protein
MQSSLIQAYPPTVQQVRDCSWWWSYPPNGEPHVLQLDVVVGCIVHCVGGDVSRTFHASDWPGRWAPCLPPIHQ